MLHWIFGWEAYKNEQLSALKPVEINEYLIIMVRDTMENWQSEFLQLIWQVAGLAFLLYVGSPQSKESDDRKEAKLDYLLKKSTLIMQMKLFVNLRKYILSPEVETL